MSVVHNKKGNGAPTTPPPSNSAHYTDLDTGDIYMSKGTSSVTDWVMIENGTVARAERQVLGAKVTIGEKQRVSVEGERFPEILYHGSSFKHNNLKPGFDHTGVLVEWDKTESNKFLYADESNEEAISMAFASALEQKYSLDRFQTNGDTITITLAKGEKVISKKDLAKLKIYIYIIEKSDADGWVKVNNEHNNATTEWKTKKHIDRNLLGVKEIDVEEWLKRKEIKVSTEKFKEVHVSNEDDKKDEKDVGEDIQRIRDFGEKKGLPEETINDFIADELKDNKEEKDKKVSNESLPKSFAW